MASTPQGRTKFAQTAVQLVKDCGFDGVDIDWEYPADAVQAGNFVELLRELRAVSHYLLHFPDLCFLSMPLLTNRLSRGEQHLNAYSAANTGSRFKPLITIACPAGPSNYTLLRLKDMDPHLDFYNLMAYDFAGSWDTTSGHQANIFRSPGSSATKFSADEAIAYYLSQGVKPSKMVLGMPLYGRAFLNTDQNPGSGYSGVGAADMDHGSWEAGVWDYKALPRPGAVEKYDDKVVASWSYDAGSRTMVSYDTVECARRKGKYIKERGLGGAMWWETSADRAVGDQKGLVGAVVGELGGVDQGLEKRENWLDYGQSRFDNIRLGCPGE